MCELEEINEMNEEKKIKSIIIIENIYLPFFDNLVFISIWGREKKRNLKKIKIKE